MSPEPRPILLIGCTGQVGRALMNVLAALGPLVTTDRARLDLSDPDAIRLLIRTVSPGIIVNAAAYTAVDRAESEPDLAMAINGRAPGVIAGECARIGALMVHYSTDYVFDGSKATPYLEQDHPDPLSVYGRSKLAGEQAIQASGSAHYIFRTSWVYSAEGHNFLNTILRLARERPELRIVNDQFGAPTWASDIAGMTAAVLTVADDGLDRSRSGVYHMTAGGSVSWFGFARAILDETAGQRPGQGPELVPITTADYPLPARRPANSRLDHSKLTRTFGIRPRAWREALRLCLREKKPLADPE